jgi:hypothetical protein
VVRSPLEAKAFFVLDAVALRFLLRALIFLYCCGLRRLLGKKLLLLKYVRPKPARRFQLSSVNFVGHLPTTAAILPLRAGHRKFRGSGI